MIDDPLICVHELNFSDCANSDKNKWYVVTKIEFKKANEVNWRDESIEEIEYHSS